MSVHDAKSSPPQAIPWTRSRERALWRPPDYADVVDVRPGGRLCGVVYVGIVRGSREARLFGYGEEQVHAQHTQSVQGLGSPGRWHRSPPGLVDEFARLGCVDGYDYADSWSRNPAPTSTSRHNIGIIRRSPKYGSRQSTACGACSLTTAWIHSAPSADTCVNTADLELTEVLEELAQGVLVPALVSPHQPTGVMVRRIRIRHLHGAGQTEVPVAVGEVEQHRVRGRHLQMMIRDQPRVAGRPERPVRCLDPEPARVLRWMECPLSPGISFCHA